MVDWATGTCFVDLDGTVLRHGTQELLPGALEELKRLRKEGWVIIITTARGGDFDNHPVYNQPATEAALRWANVPFDHILFNVPSPRVVIDDRSGGHIKRQTDDKVRPGDFDWRKKE